MRRSNQLLQERVMTLFGLSAADPRGNLEGVAALTCTDLHWPALTAISTQTHLPILEVDVPCNAPSRHGGSLAQRNTLASGCWPLGPCAPPPWAPCCAALRRRPRLSEPPTEGRRCAMLELPSRRHDPNAARSFSPLDPPARSFTARARKKVHTAAGVLGAGARLLTTAGYS